MIKGKLIYSDNIETIEQLTDDEFVIRGKEYNVNYVEIRTKQDIIMLQNDGFVKFDGFTMCPFCGEIDSYISDNVSDCYCSKCNMMI